MQVDASHSAQAVLDQAMGYVCIRAFWDRLPLAEARTITARLVQPGWPGIDLARVDALGDLLVSDPARAIEETMRIVGESPWAQR